MKKKSISKRRGMTVIELMVVIVILGTLITILYVNLSKGSVMDKKNVLLMKASKIHLDGALFGFLNDMGRYPTTEEGLRALIEPPESADGLQPRKSSYLLNENLLLDPWKNQYQYELTDGNYSIFTLGADGLPGGEGKNQDLNLGELN